MLLTSKYSIKIDKTKFKVSQFIADTVLVILKKTLSFKNLFRMKACLANSSFIYRHMTMFKFNVTKSISVRYARYLTNFGRQARQLSECVLLYLSMFQSASLKLIN